MVLNPLNSSNLEQLALKGLKKPMGRHFHKALLTTLSHLYLCLTIHDHGIVTAVQLELHAKYSVCDCAGEILTTDSQVSISLITQVSAQPFPDRPICTNGVLFNHLPVIADSDRP